MRANLHYIVVPTETSKMTCGRDDRWVVDKAVVYPRPGRIYAFGKASPRSKRMKSVVGRVFQPNETIPDRPPRSATEGRVSNNGRTYAFTLGRDRRRVDRRVQGAQVGPRNVLVTWVQFMGSKAWVRCLREREFVGVKPPR